MTRAKRASTRNNPQPPTPPLPRHFPSSAESKKSTLTSSSESGSSKTFSSKSSPDSSSISTGASHVKEEIFLEIGKNGKPVKAPPPPNRQLQLLQETPETNDISAASSDLVTKLSSPRPLLKVMNVSDKATAYFVNVLFQTVDDMQIYFDDFPNKDEFLAGLRLFVPTGNFTPTDYVRICTLVSVLHLLC